MQKTYEELKKAAFVSYQLKKTEDAFYACAVALKRPEAERSIKLLFPITNPERYIQNFNPDIRDGILKCLQEEGVDYRSLSRAWTLMLEMDPFFEPFFQNFPRTNALTEGEWKKIEPLLLDPFFYEGLRKVLIDYALELMLVDLRRALLLDIWPKNILKTKHLSFIGALAELCFVNEYIFPVSEEELKALQNLPADDVIAVCLAACYEAIPEQTSPKLSPVAAFKRLYEIQVQYPARQRQLRASIPHVGNIDNAISQEVRAMYEENPYPRWQYLTYPIGADTDVTSDMLFAGCGTARFASTMAVCYTNAQITATDISRASLAYGQHKKELHGLKNIEFLQCDILNLEQLDKQYDYINCTGVLHHMADPMAGWSKLLSVLRPGGFMLISLYSTASRPIQLKAKAYATEKGYQPTVEGIRAFRQDVARNFSASDFNAIKKWRDFHSVSELRDLVFHVQEKSYTLPEIRQCLETLGLEFVLFINIPPSYKEAYAKRYPDDPAMIDLDKWEEFEKDNPDTFANMYNFICKRKGEAFSPAALALSATHELPVPV